MPEGIPPAFYGPHTRGMKVRHQETESPENDPAFNKVSEGRKTGPGA